MKKIVLLSVILLFILATTVIAIVSPPFGQVVCSNSTPTIINPAGTYNKLMVTNFTSAVGVYIGPSSSITTTSAGVLLSAATGTVFVDNAIRGQYVDTVGYSSWYCLTSSGSATVGWLVR